MKSTFQLTVPPHNQEYVMFGNLGNLPHGEIEQWGILLDSQSFGMMIAHDALEHHYTNSDRITTIEEELMAVGAAQYIRWHKGFDLIRECEMFAEYRKPKAPEGNVFNNNMFNVEDCFEDTSVERDWHYNTMHWVNEGYDRAFNDFNGDRDAASRAFQFIEEQANQLRRKILDEMYIMDMPIEIEFDTEKLIWRENITYFEDNFDE